LFAASLVQVYNLLKSITLSSTLSDNDSYAQLIVALLDREYRQESGDFSPTALPLLTCKAAGGTIDDAVPAAAAWRALYIAAKLLDDVEDGTPIEVDGRRITHPEAANIATGFITLSNLALLERKGKTSYFNDKVKDLVVEFNRAVLHMASGQHRDISPDEDLDLESYREVMSAKSGSFFQLAAWAGARCATDDVGTLSLFEALGYNLGMMLQLNDDLKDFRESSPGNDLAEGHRTFPVFYALSVASPFERERLQKWLAEARENQQAEENARNLIKVLGGEVYVLAEIMRYRRRTTKVLEQMNLQDETHGEIEKWLIRLSLLPKKSNNQIHD